MRRTNYGIRSKDKLVRLLGISVALALVAGCTTTMTATSVTASSTTVSGQVYYLPRIDYMVSVDRELKSCTVAYASDAEATVEWLRYASVIVSHALSLKEAKKYYEIVLNDPILQRADVTTYLADQSRLGPDWKLEGKPSKALTSLAALLGKRVPTQDEPTLRIGVEMRAQATPLLLHDPKHVYAIQYQGMQKMLKGTDYSIETYPNGTLKSINVTLDDQTGAVIQDVVKGAAKIAAASSGFPLALITKQSGERSQPPQPFASWKADIANNNSLCSAATRLKLLQREALAKQSDKDAEKNLALAQKTTKLEEALVQAIAKRDKAKAAFEELEEGDSKKDVLAAARELANTQVKDAQRAFADARDALQEAQDSAKEVTKRLEAVRKQLTLTKVTTIRPDPDGKATFALGGEDEAVSSWLDRGRVASFCENKSDQCLASRPAAATAQIAAQAAIYPSLPVVLPKKATKDDNGEQKSANESEEVGFNGVVYRQPIKATLFVCKAQECLDKHGTPQIAASNVLLSAPIDVPQLGILATLPLKNDPFQNNNLSASFAENGSLTKLTYKSNAAATKAAETFEASADTVLKYKDAKRKQETSKLENSLAEIQARTKLIDAQLALEKAQTDLEEFRNSNESSD